DGRSPGFAVSAIDGVGVQGVRVGLIRNEKPDPDEGGELVQEDVEYLRSIGVPAGIPLQLDTDGLKVPQFGRIITETEEETIDLGVIAVDFGAIFDQPSAPDLDDLFGPPTQIPAPGQDRF